VYEPVYEPAFPQAPVGTPPAALPEPRRAPAEQPVPVAAVPAAADAYLPESAAPVAPSAATAPVAPDGGALPGQRVRGANLPDLGTPEAAALPPRDPAAIGRQLSSLQASVTRARHEAAADRAGDHHTQGSAE